MHQRFGGPSTSPNVFMSVVGDSGSEHGVDGDVPELEETDDEEEASDHGSARRGPRPPRIAGVKFVLFLLASLSGWWPTVVPGVVDEAALHPVLFSVLVAQWVWVSTQDANAHQQNAWFRQAAAQTRGNVKGFIAYKVACCQPWKL